jgi:hypothetical protein
MADDHIQRLRADPDRLDFAGLREQGIDLLQGLSRNGWTDYNLHDPGVTLLETLCYGLTDLVYRTDFDVADFLTDESGTISFHAQALFPPQDIFPTAPVTDIDFCKLIYDRLAMVDDVWIESHPPGEAESGLFKVYVKPASIMGDDPREVAGLRRQVTTLLAQHRNLCRDAHDVVIVETLPCILHGEIEIDDSRPAADIYADIYFHCAKAISSGGQITRYEAALHQGNRWEELLSGPLTTHGYIEDSHFDQANFHIDIPDLITLVRHTAGVKQVRSLWLESGAGKPPPKRSAGKCLELPFPDAMDVMEALKLVRGNGAGHVAAPHLSPQQFLDQVSMYLRKLEFEHNAFRNNDVNLQQLIKLPKGRYRDADAYTSVGEHLPDIYGINHHGVPKSEPPEVHARAWQLKAYLYPFEQMMANYLASLQGIKRLYSIEEALDKSYFAQFLGDGQVPKLEMLYGDNVDQARVDAVLREHDTFADRRNRVLDSLLAIYGEVFPSAAMRRYDVYHAEDIDLHLIQCKIGLLNDLCRLSANRGNAMNVEEGYWTGYNYASLQHRVQLLSGGSADAIGRSLISGINNDTVKFISDQRYLKKLDSLSHPQVAYADTIELALDDGGDVGVVAALPHDALSPALMTAGVQRVNYRVLPAGDGRQGWLCLSVDGGCWPIALMPLDELPRFGARLRRRLIALSMQCEGFHLLEHMLLRRRVHDTGYEVEHDFHAHRVSVILPGFTARYASDGCRAWIEELIAQNLPAHILPDFYWLDFGFMAQFERRYGQWLTLLQAVSTGDAELTEPLDAAAVQLVEFLATISKYQQSRMWL